MDKPLVSLSVLFVPLAFLSTLGKKQKKDFQCLFKMLPHMLGNKTKQNKYFAHFLVSFNMFPNAFNFPTQSSFFNILLVVPQHHSTTIIPNCFPNLDKVSHE